MTQQLNPYIAFNGNCAEAMAFYGEALGAQPHLAYFGDTGVDIDGVMHAALDTPDGFHLFACDHPEGMGELKYGNNVQISLSGDDAEALHRHWDALSDGGQVTVPLEKQMWGDEYGQFIDRFGIVWHVNIAGAQA